MAQVSIRERRNWKGIEDECSLFQRANSMSKNLDIAMEKWNIPKDDPYFALVKWEIDMLKNR